MAPAKGFVKAAQLCFALLMAGAFLHLLNYVEPCGPGSAGC